MSRRGRKKKFKLKFNIRTETLRSITAITLVLFSGIVLVSSLAGGYSVNSKIQEILRTGLGFAYFLLIPIFFIGGLLLINSVKWRFVEGRVLAGLVILLFSLSGLFHAFIREDTYSAARDGNGGGLIGYKLVQILESTISIYGAFLVFLAFAALAMLLILDKSLDEILQFFANQAQKAGFIKTLPFFAKKDKTAEAEGDIEITSGFNIKTDTADEESEEVFVSTVKGTPSFEVIPSMAEPQSDLLGTAMAGIGGSITTLSPTLPYSDRVWEHPPTSLLNDSPNTQVDRGDVNKRAKIIEETLAAFGIEAEVKDKRFGPSVTQYALETKSGTKIAKIANLQYDLALALASPTGSVRIEAPIPGRSLVGIEVPNNTRVVVNFKEVLTSDPMKNLKHKLGIILGVDVGGQPAVYNIAKMPHLLIAGATGSGKSVFIHSIMASVLFRASPEEVKFILIDPKRVELVHYNDIPHLLTPVLTDLDKAAVAFKWLVQEMERRYKLLEAAKVRNIESYNEKSGFQALPYIILIVDELGEIMVADPAAVEKSIIRLAQLARATGIHLVLALQRPSTNVITGLIKANIPCRIAFNVTSQVDSRVIIDQTGAEKLLGQGDMLFVPPDDSKPIRLQGAIVTDKEISNLVNYLKSMGTPPSYKEDMFNMPEPNKSVAAGGDGVDPLFNSAMETIIEEGRASASLLQRRLSIGYSRAARILDELEAKGIVGPPRGSKPREILVGHAPDSKSDMNNNRDDFERHEF